MSKNMANTFDLVMFDLDGTLVATAPEIHDAVNDTLSRFALKGVRQEQVEAWMGHGAQALLAQAVAFSSEMSVALVRGSDCFALVSAEFDRYYQSRCGTRSELYPHVREVLGDLRRRGVKLAVVTNKEERFTRAVLTRHALLPLLDQVISGDSLPARKPDPAGLLACMKALGVPAERALFVGDSAIDVAAARNAGIAVWGATYGYNQGQPIARRAPDRLIGDLRALLGGNGGIAITGEHFPWP
jgi:phosphoglycolate phosphatase